MHSLLIVCPCFTNHYCPQGSVSQEDLAILAWGQNYMHNKAVVHKDEWEEFFHHYHRLRQGNFWKLDACQVVDWERYIDTLVPFLLGN